LTSAKNLSKKPSVVAKNLSKGVFKAIAAKLAASKLAKAKQAAAALPLLAPEVPPPAPPPPSDPLLGKSLRVVHDASLAKYGVEGSCLSHSLSTGAVQLMCVDKKAGVLSTFMSCCVEVDSAWAKPPLWKQLTLSRHVKFELCLKSGLISEDPDADTPPEELEPITAEVLKKGLLDQHLSLAGELLMSWHWASNKRGHLIRIVSPCLIQRLWLCRNAKTAVEMAVLEELRKALRAHFEGPEALVLATIWASGHYVLLCMRFEEAELRSVRYVDSLTEPSAPCRFRAQWALSMFSTEPEVLPERHNAVFQPPLSLGLVYLFLFILLGGACCVLVEVKSCIFL
jgi:hypothetical protein